MQLGIDVSNIPQNTPHEALPAGWYRGHISESEIKPTNAGTGRYIKFVITAGGWADTTPAPTVKIANRKVFFNINFENPNQEAVQIGLSELSALGHAVGVTQIQDTNQLHNIPFEFLLNHYIDPKYGPSNDVKGFRPVTGQAMPAAPGAPAMQPAAPAMQQQPAPAMQGQAAPAPAPAPMQQQAPAPAAPGNQPPWNQ